MDGEILVVNLEDDVECGRGHRVVAPVEALHAMDFHPELVRHVLVQEAGKDEEQEPLPAVARGSAAMMQFVTLICLSSENMVTHEDCCRVGDRIIWVDNGRGHPALVHG